MIIGGITVNNPKLPVIKRNYRPSIRPEFESNDTGIRDLSNRTRRMWTFNWDGEYMLPHYQYEPLETFLMENMGHCFSLVLPFSNIVIGNVFCMTDDVIGEEHIPNIPERGIIGMYKLQLQLGEL